MEKINIAELLKDCPKGMGLDCTIFENVEFDHIDENNATYYIICRVKTEWGGYNVHTFTKHGCYSTEKYSKCAIFPKGKTTWKGFVPPVQFKYGDRIKEKQSGVIGEVIDVQQKKYNVKVDDNKGLYVYFHEQDNWELLPNKFDITTLKPFDKVLVRRNYYGRWEIDFFGYYNKGDYHTTGASIFEQCIPYKENEHLLGTTNDCDEYYKTWE